MEKEKGINILQKEYWKTITPELSDARISGKNVGRYSSDNPVYVGIKQSEFLRQYDPEGHKINSTEYYPNIIKYDEETKQYYEEEISRVAFSFQQIILTKQLSALCGNPTRFRLPIADQTEVHEKQFTEWKEGWAVKDMDILVYNALESIGKTGDVAVYMYIDSKGLMRYKVFSFDKGDMLFPHYDEAGEIDLFARKYTSINSYGEDESRIDIFTRTHVFSLKEAEGKDNDVLRFVDDKYIIEDYVMIDKPMKHGLDFVPIAYHRDDKGAWWSASQKTIEEFEWSFSCLTHSNMAYAFPIMYIKGSEVVVEPDMIRNSVKAIIMPNKESDAGFLQRPDGSSSFELQLKKLYDMIYQQSFTVNPPEVRSGDLPGVAIKLLYSPSIEKANEMAKKLNPFLDVLVDMFTYFYGIEVEKLSEFKNLKVYAYLEPYVHQNDSEVIKNLETSVNAGFLSKKSATEISPYSNNNEIDRIEQEVEAAYQLDSLTDLKATIDGEEEIDIIPKEKEEVEPNDNN
ncbi:MAG: phage portal protein [Bacteroides sp.]